MMMVMMKNIAMLTTLPPCIIVGENVVSTLRAPIESEDFVPMMFMHQWQCCYFQ